MAMKKKRFLIITPDPKFYIHLLPVFSIKPEVYINTSLPVFVLNIYSFISYFFSVNVVL